MVPSLCHVLPLAVLLIGFSLHAAEPQSPAFAAWQVTGNVSEDTANLRPGGNPGLRMEPGARAVWKIGEEGGGEVVFWTLDDGTVSMPDKKRHTGPRWGLVDGSGNELLLAVMYAPYLHEDGSYVLFEKNNPGAIKYLGGRQPGKWQKWTLRFDPATGAKLLINDKPADNRWNWNESKFPGFSGVVVYGDSAGGAKAQDFTVEVAAATAGPMTAKPVEPPPPPPVVPESDPRAEGDVPKFRDGLLDQHPRLLFTKADVPRLKAFYESPEGAPWKERLDRYAAASNPPRSPAEAKFLKDATDGQRQGLWRLPTVALHFVLNGDEASRRKVIDYLELLEAMPHWEDKPELDSGMSSANVLIGAALAFDWLYDELEPEFREKFRRKLWLQARAQYHGGHLNKNNSVGYWQGDTHNNHRWHRNAGLTLAVLTAYTGDPSENWLLQKTAEELAYVAKWLPEDGSSHESAGYLIFGGNHLVLAFDAADHCLGTTLLEAPFFRNAGYFRILSLTSGLKKPLPFGDDTQEGLGHYGNFLLLAAEKNKQEDVGAMLRRVVEVTPSLMEYGWFSLLWDRPGFGRGSAEDFPTIGYFPDIGLAYLHDSWKPDGVSAMFKSSPFGGFTLNTFRANPDGTFRYVNVAHDDPDANSFIIAMGDELVAQTDGYSKKKQSSNHNTILVNGMGQMSAGRPEGMGWSQPGNSDMTGMARVTGWLHNGAVTAIEGEAAGSYLAYTDRKSGKSRPALDRFRRSFFWVEGEYVLVLDDVRATAPADITWLLQAPSLKEEADGKFTLASGDKSLTGRLVSDREMQMTVGAGTADERGKVLGWQQLQATVAQARQVRFASVYNPWGRGAVTATLTPRGDGEAGVTVSSADFTDEWTWKVAADDKGPSAIQVRRTKGRAPEGFPFDFSKAAQPDVHGPAILVK